MISASGTRTTVRFSCLGYYTDLLVEFCKSEHKIFKPNGPGPTPPPGSSFDSREAIIVSPATSFVGWFSGGWVSYRVSSPPPHPRLLLLLLPLSLSLSLAMLSLSPI
ncbi:hypothetical protein RIF29_08252 [Crotalaria pallida]|uniref:Uncharacterized protein n=1 Tax=Crotalaria pallida TaxID=3830 RepID=A0AAN9J6L1_CROPI